MPKFAQEFNSLNFAIKESSRILLFAHSNPDGDTIGAVLAIREYIISLGKTVDIACFDPFPEMLKDFYSNYFNLPAQLDIRSYNLIIAADSVERGYDRVKDKIAENQVTALLDHHPDISLRGDINIIDSSYSSVCEIIYEFLVKIQANITQKMASSIMLGILWDTGMFQHANTSPHIMKIASELLNKGASMHKIVSLLFASKKINTLKLWGRAFEKAKINRGNGMIVSVLTLRDLEECQADTEDVAQVAAILNTVPGTKFSLILSERKGGIIKGSLRSEEYKNIDVSKIAAEFGGGGHKLASGFEMKGKIVEMENGWKII